MPWPMATKVLVMDTLSRGESRGLVRAWNLQEPSRFWSIGPLGQAPIRFLLESPKGGVGSGPVASF